MTTTGTTTRGRRHTPMTHKHKSLSRRMLSIKAVLTVMSMSMSIIMVIGPMAVSAQLEPPKHKAERPLMPPPRVPPKVTQKVYMDFEIVHDTDANANANDSKKRAHAKAVKNEVLRLTFHLFGEQCPTAVDNFVHLITGDLGTENSVSGKALDYKDSTVHRIVPHFMIQAGDFTHGTGVGGEAAVKSPGSQIYFDDDPQCLDKSIYTDKYFLSMANKGPNTNGSQFFITTVKTRWLDHKHMLFGRLVVDDDFDDTGDLDEDSDTNLENLTYLESLGTSSGTPSKTIRIVECGVLPLKKETAEAVTASE